MSSTESMLPPGVFYAGYGRWDKVADATSAITNRYLRGQREFPADNSYVGDPYPGVVKALYVVWVDDAGGHSRVCLERDGHVITLPEIPALASQPA